MTAHARVDPVDVTAWAEWSDEECDRYQRVNGGPAVRVAQRVAVYPAGHVACEVVVGIRPREESE